MKIHPFKSPTSAKSNLTINLVAQAKEKVEASLAADFPKLPEHLLHLALNEAEAIAWNAGYPQLMFPILAEEKATQLLHWHIRQEFLTAGSDLNMIA